MFGIEGRMQPIVRAADLDTWVTERAAGSERYLLGIAGAPGSGKSTVASALSAELAAPVVPMDGFHLPNAVLDERGLREVKGAPLTFAADAFVSAIASLRPTSEVVSFPAFDRAMDEPCADRIHIRPAAGIVIVEGNYLLLDSDPWRALVGLLDDVAFISLDDDVRRHRLVERHVEFGKTRTDAIAFVESSDEPNAQLIDTTRRRADVIVEQGS